MNSIVTRKNSSREKKPVPIDETYEMIDNVVPGLNGITLRPHQQTVIAALLAIEDKRCLNIVDGTNPEYVIRSNSVILSEPFGTGKTFEIIALCLLRPIPRATPDVIRPTKNRFFEIVKTFTGPGVLIRPNLIVVGSSVVGQWEKTFSTYTNLKVFVVSHYVHLKNLQMLIDSGDIKHYDIVLIKNGNVAGKFNIPENNTISAKEHNSIISVIAAFSMRKCWSRVIYDDYDTIRIPGDAPMINSLFSVYVSATVKKNTVTTHPPTAFPSALDYLRSMQRYLNNVVYDNMLNTYFNVRNTAEFVELSTNVPIMNQYKYVYKNPDDNFIQLIGAMGEENANRVMEMLNADAFSTAAEHMGIKTGSIADIFQKVLDNKYNEYISAGETIRIIDANMKVLADLPYHEKGKSHSEAKMASIKAHIMRGDIIGERIFKYKSDRLEGYLYDLKIEQKGILEQAGVAINRVIDNAKEGMCQICCLDLHDLDTFIVKCCGIILCDECGIKGSQLGKHYDTDMRGISITGKCANCKHKITMQDLIFLDKNFSIESLLSAKGTEKEPIAPKEEVVSEEERIKNPKLRALLAIINGKVAENRSRTNVHIDRLLVGTIDICGNEPVRKVAVFASFDETLSIIENFLKEESIGYMRLWGTANAMTRTVQEFKTGRNNVLLINSQQHCAGLNLEFCTDMVLFHYIMDNNVIGQVVARCQRMMRTCNLNLHFLCYKNEEYIVKKRQK